MRLFSARLILIFFSIGFNADEFNVVECLVNSEHFYSLNLFFVSLNLINLYKDILNIY